jgi:hypothetical protein
LPGSVFATVVNALLAVPAQAIGAVARFGLGVVILAIVLADTLAILPGSIRAAVVVTGTSDDGIIDIPSLNVMEVIRVRESRDRAQREQGGHKDLFQQHDGQLSTV